MNEADLANDNLSEAVDSLTVIREMQAVRTTEHDFVRQSGQRKKKPTRFSDYVALNDTLVITGIKLVTLFRDMLVFTSLVFILTRN